MKIKVAEATPDQLRWLVASAQFKNPFGWDAHAGKLVLVDWLSWALLGQVLSKEMIGVQPIGSKSEWCAGASEYECKQQFHTGVSPEIAIAKCFVVTKLGHEVEVPEVLS